MPNYFDYISESSEVEINSPDDIDVIYNEMDASMCEFDSYVQEGVGVALAAVGGAGLLAGIIALIVKCFGSSSPSSVAKTAKEAKKALDKAEKSGAPVPNIPLPTVESIQQAGTYIKWEIDNCENIVEEELNSETDQKPTPANDKPEDKNTKPEEKQTQQPPIVYTKPTSYADAKERVVTAESVSREIEQKQKSLKQTEKRVQNAQRNGKRRTNPQHQRRLKNAQGKTGKAITSTAAKMKMGIDKFIHALDFGN